MVRNNFFFYRHHIYEFVNGQGLTSHLSIKQFLLILLSNSFKLLFGQSLLLTELKLFLKQEQVRCILELLMVQQIVYFLVVWFFVYFIDG